MKTRDKTALVTLIVGLALNIALGTFKLVVGILSNSGAVSSDAINNLSDAAVSVVTIIAIALASRAADHDHPYGHGRYEYVATFILGAVIVAVGAEVLIGGIKRAITPEPVVIDLLVFVSLGTSIAVKAFMAVFYFARAKITGMETIRAAAIDAVSDAVVTSVVLACAVAELKMGVHIDGYVSIAVAVVILVFAVRILKSVINSMLGTRPDPALTERLIGIISSDGAVLSMHDLVINDYGANNKIAEVDVVLPAEMSFVEIHGICDRLERKAKSETGVKLCVHADPFVSDDERLSKLSEKIEKTLESFSATAHDVKIDDDGRTVNLDIKLDGDKAPEAEIGGLVEALVRGELGYSTVIEFDYI